MLFTLIGLDYFTPKLEIKPQLGIRESHSDTHYFTPKLEIKPQLAVGRLEATVNYFTPKLEIKPQLNYHFLQV